MNKIYIFLRIFSFLLFSFVSADITAQVTQTFSFTGVVQTFTVPSCVSSLTLDVKGAQGAANSNSVLGGLGGSAIGVMTVTAGNVLFIYVGGTNGYNGGGNPGPSACTAAMGGFGGGGSDIRFGGNALANRVICGAGGGGAGGDRINTCGRGTGGGGGGGYYGGGGGSGYPQNSTTVPTGGTQTAGGAAGISTFSSGQNGLPGVLGIGGDGGLETSTNQAGANSALPGGVGGGLVGGSGQQPSTNVYTGQSGAGGSSYISTALTNSSTISGNRNGNGLVTITYNFNGNGVVASASPSLLCTGSSATLNASGMNSYTWSPSSSYASSIIVSPSSTSSYTVSGTNSVGCVSSSILTLTVNTSPPTLSVTQSTTNICPSETVILSASGAVNYVWTGGVTNGIPFAPLSTSNYTVSGINGCGTTTAVAGVTVTSLPVVAVASPTLICSNAASTLSAGGAINYTWNPGSLYGPSIVVSPTASTIYTVVGTTSICAGVSTVVLSVNPIPTITIVPSNSIVCAGTTVTLTASGGNNYTWTPGNLNGASVTVNPNSAASYIATGDNSFGCTSTANQVIVTLPNPTVNLISNFPQACVGASVIIFASGANTYSWSVPGTTNSVTVIPLVNTTYSCTGTNTNNGCSNTKTISVSVFTVPLTVSGPTNVCLGNSVTISATGANSYIWGIGLNNSVLVVSPSTSTIYIVSATTQSNGMSCSTTGSVSVTVNPLPNITAAATRTSMCKNESVTVTATGASLYLWSNLNTNASFVLKATIVTTYDLSVTGTDNNGCENTATVTIKSSACAGIESFTNNNKGIVIFPNPSAGDFNIISERELVLDLVNELGQHIQRIVLDKQNYFNVKVPALPNGIYFLNGESEGKIIKEKILIVR